jgi:hypothetical protein
LFDIVCKCITYNMRAKRPHMKANLYPKLFFKREGVPFDQNFANKWFALQKSFFKLFSGFLVFNYSCFWSSNKDFLTALGFTLQKSITTVRFCYVCSFSISTVCTLILRKRSSKQLFLFLGILVMFVYQFVILDFT